MIIRQEFETRVEEVIKYFDFINIIETADFRLLSNYTQETTFNIDEDLLKILKANGFIILYNLIESTIYNSVVAIFDEITIDNLNYHKVTENVKRFWLRHTFSYDNLIIDENHIYKKCYNIVQKIFNDVHLSITEKLKYGGSLDARGIKNLAGELGIVLSEEHYNVDLHGTALLNIKSNRNDLAHGKKSFSDIAKDITYKGEVTTNSEGVETIQSLGLIHYKSYAIEHLEKYIDSIELYIQNKSYKVVL